MSKQIAITKSEQLQKFLNLHGVEFMEKKGELIFNSDSPQNDFELGMDWGREKFSEKPETFSLYKEYVSVLKEAIQLYQRQNMISVDSIHFEETEFDMVNITVYPTKGLSLFGIYSQYGKLIEGRKNQIAEK